MHGSAASSSLPADYQKGEDGYWAAALFSTKANLRISLDQLASIAVAEKRSLE